MPGGHFSAAPGRGRYWRWADGSGVDDDKPVNQMEGLDLAREAFVVLIRSGQGRKKGSNPGAAALVSR